MIFLCLCQPSGLCFRVLAGDLQLLKIFGFHTGVTFSRGLSTFWYVSDIIFTSILTLGNRLDNVLGVCRKFGLCFFCDFDTAVPGILVLRLSVFSEKL